VLGDARSAKPTQAVKVYPVPGDTPLAAGGAAVDPAPLRGYARRTAGMDLPASLADVGALETRCDGKPEWFTVADFGKLGATFKDWFKGDWTRKNHLVDLQTWLVVPADAPDEVVIAAATANEKIQYLMQGKQLVRSIVVKNKLVNLILK
jgi:hypothetical protein